MKIAIGSCFRNSVHQLRTYMQQLSYLKLCCDHGGIELLWIAVEGDSTDRTREWLPQLAREIDIAQILVQREHGGPVYGSTESPARMKALSYVGNGILESVPEDVDALIYVESDLIWDAQTLLKLVAMLGPGVDVLAPLVFAGDNFYDVYLFRKDGERFAPFPPYHKSLSKTELTEVDSAGSCLVMKGFVARQCRLINDAALLGFCADVKAHGLHIWVDPLSRIKHP